MAFGAGDKRFTAETAAAIFGLQRRANIRTTFRERPMVLIS